jgi:hypothetical protein
MTFEELIELADDMGFDRSRVNELALGIRGRDGVETRVTNFEIKKSPSGPVLVLVAAKPRVRKSRAKEGRDANPQT